MLPANQCRTQDPRVSGSSFTVGWIFKTLDKVLNLHPCFFLLLVKYTMLYTQDYKSQRRHDSDKNKDATHGRKFKTLGGTRWSCSGTRL